MNTKEQLLQILHDVGINTDLDNELDLAEQFDSITFLSTVLELEAVFEIAIPDEYLNMQFFASVDHTVEILEQLMQDTLTRR